MSIKISSEDLNPQSLVKYFIQLNGVRPAEIADASNIRRPNFYTWFKGGSQILSEQMITALMDTLGVINGMLSNKIIHRWQVGESLDAMKMVLDELFDKDALAKIEIYFVDCGKNRFFNLLLTPNNATILVAYGKSNGDGYPLNAAKCGFGIEKGVVEIPHRIWEEWRSVKPPMSTIDFWISADPFFCNVAEIKSPVISPENLIDIRTKYEKEIIEQTAVNAGLRGLIRALLSEIREMDSKNSLLKHNERDQIYEAHYNAEVNKHAKNATKT
ncbi:MAG: hypothetical protein H7Z73_03480 [Candidatus Saccharibacteria bacterium]|nr:hypothetical protein [Moraxellaceae bacterium]